MRCLVVLAIGLAACSHSQATSDATQVDADACAKQAPVAPSSCVAGGLASIALDGEWTLTGQRMVDAGSGAYTSPMWIRHDGTGWCTTAYDFAKDPMTAGMDPTTYIDDTVLEHTLVSSSIHGSENDVWTVCVDRDSGALHFHEDEMSTQEGAGQHSITIDGVLTR